MHLVPFRATNSASTTLFDEVCRNPRLFTPIGGPLSDVKLTFDGLLTGSNSEGLNKQQRAYVHVFRSGVVEAAVSSLAPGQQGECPILPYLHAITIKYCRQYARSLNERGIELPFAVLASLLNVKGKRLIQDFITTAVSVDILGNYLNNNSLYAEPRLGQYFLIAAAKVRLKLASSNFRPRLHPRAVTRSRRERRMSVATPFYQLGSGGAQNAAHTNDRYIPFRTGGV